MTQSEWGREMETYALASHGLLVVGHALGAEWNRRRGRRFLTGFHIVAALISLGCVIVHAHDR